MKRRFSIALCIVLVTGLCAFAGSPAPVALHTFACTGSAFQRSGPCPGGGRPNSLIIGSDGNFYGAAQASSEGLSQPPGGTVFSVTPAGQFKLLHTFPPGTSNNYPQGENPGYITEGPDGNLYGTTLFGGVKGQGVLYRVSKQGTGFQVLHQFCSAANCSDGAAGGLLVSATDGNIYGTTAFGGTGGCQGGCGTIFRVTPSTGAYQVVFNFNGTTDGAFPGGLTPAPDGTFYGFAGSMFHYSPATGAFQVFAVAFPGFNNGLPSHPTSGLVLGPDGNFFGLYSIYGVGGAGLFEVAPDGSNLKLFPEYNTQPNGGSPSGLLLASDGNFWVPDYNGVSGYGDIVVVSPSDGTVVERFSPFGPSAVAGAYPAVLLQAQDGMLWGSSYQYGRVPSGHFGDGVVFSLNAGLPAR